MQNAIEQQLRTRLGRDSLLDLRNTKHNRGYLAQFIIDKWGDEAPTFLRRPHFAFLLTTTLSNEDVDKLDVREG